jgi:hypothetical protein
MFLHVRRSIMLEWLTFFSTLGLLVVTGWYAILTRSLALSARDSSRSAELAAQFAAQSAAAAVATLDIGFEVTPSYQFGVDNGVGLGVTLTCSGSTVFVHGASLIEALRSTKFDKGSEEFDSVWLDDEGRALVEDRDFPLRIHKGETLHLETSPEIVIPEHVSIAGLSVRVRYSIDGKGEQIEREVEWYGKRGIDYQTHA